MTKKNYKQKILSAITKNLNWQILTNNLATFKRQDGVKDEKFSYYGSTPVFRGRGSQKNNILMELAKKGAWQKRGKRVFLRGGGRRFDTPMHTMTQLWYMSEPEIGLADVSELHWSGSFLQYNAEKKINMKSSSRFEFKR